MCFVSLSRVLGDDGRFAVRPQRLQTLQTEIQTQTEENPRKLAVRRGSASDSECSQPDCLHYICIASAQRRRTHSKNSRPRSEKAVRKRLATTIWRTRGIAP